MITEIGEPIKVGAVFYEEKRIIPKWFVWQGRKYTIQRITFTWQVKEGSVTLYHFSVTDGNTLFEICYHPTTLRWHLMAISPL
jgi:hypothetical protein